MDFGGGPLWDDTALVDILPLEPVSRKRGQYGQSHLPTMVKESYTISREIDAALQG